MTPAPSAPTVTRLGVVGWPVGHSRSPAMHNAALSAVGLADRWHYQHLPVPPDVFAQTIPALAGSGFRGVNVTIPHKRAALALADTPSERATAIGAANTLIFGVEGTIAADNTDAPALTGAITELLDGGAQGRSAIVIGAGGSGRAAVWALIDAGAASVRIWNRTQERAEELAADLGADVATSISSADLLVNCTSVGLSPQHTLDDLPIDPRIFAQAAVVIDFVYGAGATPIAQAAKSAGVPLIDGLELLVRQGAESFTQFTGVPAPINVMRAAASGISEP